MPLKCCTQCVSKFGKFSSGHRTGKCSFSLQSQRRAMPKNVQPAIQLPSFHMLASSQSSKLGFSTTWTKNFQMYNLGLEKAEEPEIKLPTSVDLKECKGIPKKILLLLHWLPKSFWLCGSQKLWKILKEMGIPDHFICLLRNFHEGQEATVRTRHGNTDWFKIGKGAWQGCILSPCLFNLRIEYIMQNVRLNESQAGITIAGEISTTLDMQIIPLLWQKLKRN